MGRSECVKTIVDVMSFVVQNTMQKGKIASTYADNVSVILRGL